MTKHPDYINISLPEYIVLKSAIDCGVCYGKGLVCEEHPDKSWESGLSTDCTCGAAGMPCKCTGLEE